MTLPSWVDLPDPDDTTLCPDCDANMVIYRAANGDVIGTECNACAHRQRVERMLAILHACMTHTPTLPRERPQSSAEIAHGMTCEQHGEDLRDGTYDWCQYDPARDDRDADREARVAS